MSFAFSPRIIPVIASRDLFPKTLNESGLIGEGAEIGVLQGDFSEWILRHWKGKCLHSIDPWRHFSDGSYVDGHNLTNSIHDQHFQIAIKKLNLFGDRSKIHRKRSDEASLEFTDETLDFVYIDAQHHYEAVRDDIERWHPKVKVGGIIGGHDFFKDGDYLFGRFGVQKAVIEFAARLQSDILVSEESVPPPFEAPSWFMVKR